MLNINDIPLQALRITEGWTINHNRFYDLRPEGDLKIEGVTNNDGWLLFDQDLLQIEHKKKGVVLDLGWYPDEDPNGKFRVVLVGDGDWSNLLIKHETNNKDEVVKVINDVVYKVTIGAI